MLSMRDSQEQNFRGKSRLGLNSKLNIEDTLHDMCIWHMFYPNIQSQQMRGQHKDELISQICILKKKQD